MWKKMPVKKIENELERIECPYYLEKVKGYDQALISKIVENQIDVDDPSLMEGELFFE